MRLLLDTQALILWVLGLRGLTEVARDAITDPNHDLLVSVVSLWEGAIKRGVGKLDFPTELADMMESNGFTLLPITLPHLAGLARLPMHHRDPFDRLLAAQALSEDLPIVTGDRRMNAYGVRTIW
jgi:PIN domain nuclease of toxin-antitoxin system